MIEEREYIKWIFLIICIKYITTMFRKLIVVDAKGHMLGRLASYVAKALLSGTY